MSNKSNRRRENAQTASSSKAAELLQKNSGLSIPFLGIEALNLGTKVPSSELSVIPVDNSYDSIAPELKIIFKKLTKKDSSTREKAMKELIEHIKPEDELRFIFPYFASNYSKLVTDNTPKIRAYANVLLLTFLKALRSERKAGKYSWGSVEATSLKLSIPFLLLSLNDKFDQVSKLAENLLKECFPNQKRTLMLRTYAKEAMSICMEIVQLKQKLVQAQQFVEDETDAQRQARLVAQALETMGHLVCEDYENCRQMCEDFFQASAVITSLINSNVINIRVATFAFLSSLLQKNQELCFGTKIPSLILNNLDAESVALSRNAFKCFLTMAGNPRFFESCKIDKAVMPKLLGVVRKKNVHWAVLETSLLPTFALICKTLNELDRRKWICSMVDSFFEGSVQSISIVSWATSFNELCRHSFANFGNDSKLICFLFTKILQFVDVILDNFQDDAILEQAITLIHACSIVKADKDVFANFKDALRLNLLNKLPGSSKMIEKLLDFSTDQKFFVEVIKDARLPNSVVIKALQKHLKILPQLQELHVLLTDRIYIEEQSQTSTENLLQLLCQYLERSGNSDLLSKFVQINDLLICKAVINIPTTCTASLLRQEEKLEIANKVFENLISIQEYASETDEKAFVSWILSQLEEVSLFSLLNMVMKNQKFTTFTMVLFESLFLAGKISKANEKEISLSLLTKLLENNEGCPESAALRLMAKLEVDLSKANLVFQEYLARDDVEFSRISNIPIFGFANATITFFLPSTKEVTNFAIELDKKFMTRMLANNDAFLLSYFAQCSEIFCEEEKLNVEDESTFIFTAAKKALFAAKVLASWQDQEKDLEAAQCYVWITSTFATFLQHHTNFLISHLKSTLQIKIPKIMQIFSSSDLNPMYIPISVAFTVAKYLSAQHKFNDTEKSELLAQFHTLDNCLFVTSLASSSFSLNLWSIKEPSSAVLELGLQEDRQTLVNMAQEFDERQISLWIYEFERILITNNMELALVTLQLFVERKGAADEWLFMCQEDLLKSTFSCVLLKIICKVVPFLAEIDSSLQDFINCGFITALQSSTDSFACSPSSKNPLLPTFSILCLQLHNAYDTSIKLNMDNQQYLDIKQEWREFFGPSSATFIIGWFLDLSSVESSPHPQFLASLCRAIASIDEHVIIKVELAEKDVVNSHYFNNYPPFLNALLSQAFSLFFDRRPEVQLASAKIFKSAMLQMFLTENNNILEANNTDEHTFQPEENKHLPQFFADLLSQQVDFGELEELQAARSSSNQGVQSLCPTIDPLLLSWDVIVRFLAELDVLHRVTYCDALDHKLVGKVMDFLFSCLPDPPGESFQNVADFSIGSIYNQSFKAFNASHFMCHLYYKSLIVMPALVRHWYTSLPKNCASTVNKYTRKHVSHLLLKRELQNVANTKKGRLEVKVKVNVNEVSACYRMEDTQIRLNIALPLDYPLSLASLETERSIVSKELHRKWLLQLEMFLGHQNGSMLEGFLQWKRNIDKHLEGIEDCTICMMTVSSTNYQLPKIRCRQCKNKFHGDCLYKWFQTSSNSSCPLCRASFV